MTDPSKHTNVDAENTNDVGDTELEARLASLDERFKTIEARKQEEARQSDKAGESQNALGMAFRLSAEFVSGILAGGAVGWGVDTLFGWSPWGLLVFLLLGFCAGMLNLFRSAGVLNRPGKKNNHESS